VTYPAAYDSVIAVTGTDASDRPGYSSPRGDALELAAPGVDVLSTVDQGGYDFLSGSSQAAPHVTGVAALYMPFNTEDLNDDGRVNHEDLRLLLQATAIDLGDAGRDQVYGYGLVNAGSATFSSIVHASWASWGRVVVSYLVDHLLSSVVQDRRWLRSTRMTLLRFWNSLWTRNARMF
jgi:subtilisin family serine protease